MSLKAFHIVFVAAATLLFFGLGGLAFRHYFSETGTMLHFALGLLLMAGGGGMIWYGRYFLRKLKHISYL